jgi:glucose-6-phosphate isomerase
VIDFPNNEAFLARPSYQKLCKLAQNPYSLTAPSPQGLSPERLNRFKASALGFTLLYGTQRIDEEVLKTLEALAHESELISQFRAMVQGETLNQILSWDSEKRAVLHTALRNLFPPPSGNTIAEEAARLAAQEMEKLKRFLERCDQEKRWEEILLVGIGGSDLGPRALYLALQAYTLPQRKADFISNVDPDDAAQVLQKKDLSKTLVIIVSKSGNTLETKTNEALVAQAFRARGLEPKEHFIAVTQKGSPLDNPQHYLESFYIWDYIGGRYSSTSMVGGVLLGFTLGYTPFLELLRGAHDMDRVALESTFSQNLPLLSALLGIWNCHFLGYPSLAILPYSQALSRFPAHLQQCDMESNGKGINRRGEILTYPASPIIWGEVGTNGQHSFYQWIHQSPLVVPVEFIGFRKSQWGKEIEVEGTSSQQKLLANLFAQSLALAQGQTAKNPNHSFPGNRPNSVLMAEQLTPYTLGALLAYYEAKIVFQGFYWNINSFDQEGVQLGKRLANHILEDFRQINLNPQDKTCFQKHPLTSALLQAGGLISE